MEPVYIYEKFRLNVFLSQDELYQYDFLSKYFPANLIPLFQLFDFQSEVSS